MHSSRHSQTVEHGLKRGQGGVGLLWRRNIKGVVPQRQLCHDRFCAVRLQRESGQVVYIISVYMPSSTSRKDNYEEVIDALSGYVDLIKWLP